jgi:hypothetical protein
MVGSGGLKLVIFAGLRASESSHGRVDQAASWRGLLADGSVCVLHPLRSRAEGIHHARDHRCSRL